MSNAVNGAKQALVLFSFRSHKHGYIELLFDQLTRTAKGRPLELRRGSLSDLHILIKDGQVAITEALTGTELADFDVLFFEMWDRASEQALAAAQYAVRNKVPFIGREPLQVTATTKIGEMTRLSDVGVPVPDTFMSSNREILRAFAEQPPLAFPVVIKAANGYGGNYNFVANTFEELEAIITEHKDEKFIVQALIPNDCDYRCLVFGGRIAVILKRTRDADSGTHLNNTSKGAAGELVDAADLPKEALDDALRAAGALGRSDYGGVDLLFDKETGKHYILEVNRAPQIETGAETEAKMRAALDYIEQRAKEKQA